MECSRPKPAAVYRLSMSMLSAFTVYTRIETFSEAVFLLRCVRTANITDSSTQKPLCDILCIRSFLASSVNLDLDVSTETDGLHDKPVLLRERIRMSIEFLG